jgi:hypothetical protein
MYLVYDLIGRSELIVSIWPLVNLVIFVKILRDKTIVLLRSNFFLRI